MTKIRGAQYPNSLRKWLNVSSLKNSLTDVKRTTEMAMMINDKKIIAFIIAR
jgi:hypothetical protein